MQTQTAHAFTTATIHLHPACASSPATIAHIERQTAGQLIISNGLAVLKQRNTRNTRNSGGHFPTGGGDAA